MSRDRLLAAILAAILIVGAAASVPALVFLSLSVGTAAILGRIWASLGAQNLVHAHSTPGSRCLVGEVANVQIRVDNPTPLPLPWVEISDPLPDPGFQLTAGPFGAEWVGLSVRTGLGWFERLRRTYQFTARRRGYYQIGPASVRVWDPLGLSFVDRGFDDRLDITVLPIMVPLDELGIAAEHPFGDPQRDRWLFKDPLSVAGARPYQSGDPMTSIHWPATAAAGTMMTRVHEGTRIPELSLFLNVTTMPVSWYGLVPELLELSITTTASVADHALHRGFAVGLYSNGSLVKRTPEDSARPIRIEPSASPGHLTDILEALAKTSDHGREPIENTITRYIDPDDYGVHTVLVTPLITPGLGDVLGDLVHRNVPLTVLYTGDPPTPPVPEGTDIYSLGGRRRWETLANR